MAVRTKWAAGRAWRSTPAGSATTASELGGTPGLLGGLHDVFDAEPGARRDRGGHGALDHGGIGEPHVPVGAPGQQPADGEDGRAEVAEHDDAGAAAARADDGVAHAVLVGAQPAAGAAAGG